MLSESEFDNIPDPDDSVDYSALDDTYHMLDELRQNLIEANGDFDFEEEIDRQNCRDMLKDLKAIERVRHLLETEMDPRT